MQTKTNWRFVGMAYRGKSFEPYHKVIIGVDVHRYIKELDCHLVSIRQAPLHPRMVGFKSLLERRRPVVVAHLDCVDDVG